MSSALDPNEDIGFLINNYVTQLHTYLHAFEENTSQDQQRLDSKDIPEDKSNLNMKLSPAYQHLRKH